MFRMFVASWVVLAACKSEGGGADMELDPKGSGSAKAGSSSGFSAELSEPVKDAAVVKAAPDKAAPAPDKGSATPTPTPTPMPTPTPTPATDKPRVPVKVSPELAAIKLSLDPNWDRDIGEPGTISFALKKPTGELAIFSFSYGYDAAGAPTDRDAYMKWLGEQKLLNVELNRQRGSAWYLQGTDGSGAPAFRYVVNYGGKHLICGGSLYKDAASNALGDLRDKVIIQAKEICETLAL